MNNVWHKKLSCKKCPYKLGLIHTLVNPCPQCIMNNYQNYDLFKKQLSKEEKLK